MFGRRMHAALIAGGVALSLTATPSKSYAIFHWFSRCCGGGAPTVAYAPVVPAAPACPQPCPQVCGYAPQTCYRTQYVSVPVTTYRPVCATDPCTGCPTTALRPVVNYTTQAQLVPYTAYRPVMATAFRPSPCSTCAAPSPCSTCAAPTTAAYAPTSYTPVVPAAAPACSSCSASATPITSMPSSTFAVRSPAQPIHGAGSTTIVSGPAYNAAPSYNTTPTTPAPQYGSPASPGTTFAPNGSAAPNGATGSEVNRPSNGQDSHAYPGPETDEQSSKGPSTFVPRQLAPQDRTTATPLQSAWSVRTASATSRQPAANATVDVDGWRASSR